MYSGVLHSTNEVVTVLSQSHFLLFPSFYPGEGFPGVFLEAFSVGTPIIALNHNYSSETFLK